MTLVVIVFLSLCFPCAAVYSYIKFKKRKTAGRELFAVSGAVAQTDVNISQTIQVASKRKWYRIRCRFKHKNPVTGYDTQTHQYTVSIKKQGGEVVFTESRTLPEFFSFCWHPGVSSDPAKQLPCECDPILLDFLPPEPGNYSISFTLKAKEPYSEVEDFTLVVSEGVWPLNQKPYLHTCINLRKVKAPKKKDAEEENNEGATT